MHPGSPPRLSEADMLAKARQVLTVEADTLRELASRLDSTFAAAVLAIHANPRVIASGVGKAGLIAQKVAATLASTGTPAYFVHAAEAMHGDLGMISAGDVALLFSRSGETEEVCRLLPHLAHRQVKRIAITGSARSTLARGCDLVIELGAIAEACPLALAPSSSTTAMLAVGDALALTVLEARGFTEQDFAALHPGGRLGLALRAVGDCMRSGERCPTVAPETPVRQVVAALTGARSGCACVVNGGRTLLGVFTDGDFRRRWADDPQIGERPVAEVMTKPGLSIRRGSLVREARALMARYHINALPVLDEAGQLVGLLDLQDVS